MAKIGRLSHYVGLSLVISWGGLAVQCFSQAHAVNVQDCFSPNLLTHRESISVTAYQWVFLSMINEQNYQDVKNSFQGNALTPWGDFSGDFSHFEKWRRNYFALHSESINYYHSMASNEFYLPDAWRPTIDKCIAESLRAEGTGLMHVEVNSDPSRFRLEVKYNSTEKTYEGPYVISSELEGGYVKLGGQPRHSLYQPCSNPKKPASCPDINARSEFLIYRDNPNKPVTVILNLSNAKHSTSFDVPIVAKKVYCKPTYEGSERQTKILIKQHLFCKFS